MGEWQLLPLPLAVSIPFWCAAAPCLDAWGGMSTPGIGGGCRKTFYFFFAFKDGLIVHFFLQSAGLCTSPWLEIIFFPASVLTSLLPTTPASYSSLPSLQMIFFFEILSSKTGREKQRGKKKVLALPFSPSTCPWIYFSRAWDGASSILEWARPKKGWGQKINIWA